MLFFPELLREDPFHCLFQLQETTHIPRTMALPYLQTTVLHPLLPLSQLFSYAMLPLPLIRTLVITLDLPGKSNIICPSQGHKISNPNFIYTLNSPLQCNTTPSQVPCIRTWTSLGDIILQVGRKTLYQFYHISFQNIFRR